ncbi:hypothetical protein AO275_15975 [Pseudomonas viridiflava]|nr:hypothetical protein AO275_15975 [Pseudomonas viridiflava]
MTESAQGSSRVHGMVKTDAKCATAPGFGAIGPINIDPEILLALLPAQSAQTIFQQVVRL